ncbi:MAG: efflux RND transporter periplasmic adaptor subunit [Planctomycetaceae bacterium]
MRADVDLSQLALDRGPGPAIRSRSRIGSRYVLPGALLLGVCGLAVWGTWNLLFPPRAVTVVPVHVSRSAIQREGTPLFQAAGWVEPRPTPIRVAALAPGVIEELLVVEDQVVEAGEPVARLVREDAELSYRRAQADLALRQAEVAETRALLQAAATRLDQPVHLEAVVGDAEASLAKVETALETIPSEIDSAVAKVEYAQADYDRRIAARDAVTTLMREEGRSALAIARANLEGLKRRRVALDNERKALAARRDALRTQLELLADEIEARDTAYARLKSAEARVEQAEVALAEAKLRLDRMTVRAPVAGRVLNLTSDPGTRLTEGMGDAGTEDMSTVVTMYRPESQQVRVDVRFADIPHVALGQPVRIENPAVKEPLSGRVLFISSRADIQKNTLEVKVSIDSPPSVFKPEMLVDVTFLAPEILDDESEPSEELRIYVPQRLITRDGDAAFVWVADQSEGRARRVSVELGAASGDGLVEVASGLTIASRLIAGGHDGLRDGDRIRVTGEETLSEATAPAAERSRNPSRFPTGDAS